MNPSNHSPQIKDICQFFWDIENEFGLLNYEIKQFPVWEYARINLYFLLLKQLKIGQDQQQFTSLKSLPLSAKIKDVFTTWIFRNPILRWTQCNILILEHPRLTLQNNKYIDIYTNSLENEFDKNNLPWRSLTADSSGQYLKENIPNRFRTLALRRISTIIKKLKPLHLSEKDVKLFTKIETICRTQFGDSIHFVNHLDFFLNRMHADYRAWTLLLKVWRPKKIFLVMGYAIHSSLCFAAKKLNIPVIEIQHGNFSKYHLGYSYPNPNTQLKCFPDEFLVWSEAWKNRVPFSQDMCKLSVRPFDWIEQNKAKYSNIKKEKSLLVLSQGMLGDLVAEKLLQHMETWKHYKIYYKLHPGEFSRWESYPSLKELINNYDVEVVTTGNLHQLMATCSDQVGVFSTAIYEGIEFGCKTWLLNLPGVEGMEELIESGEATLLK